MTITKKPMKLTINLSIFLFSMLALGKESFSLSDYYIKQICKNDKRESTCIKILKEKRNELQEGKFIEIPVIPYKR